MWGGALGELVGRCDIAARLGWRTRLAVALGGEHAGDAKKQGKSLDDLQESATLTKTNHVIHHRCRLVGDGERLGASLGSPRCD